MSDVKFGVILPAAGRSRRFGLGDKLSQDLGGRPLLLRTVEIFTRRDDVGAIVVAAPPDEVDEFRTRYGAQLGFHGATVVAGGTVERWETVRNALAAVPADCTHIAVHDAARPAASDELVERVFTAARVHDAVIPGDPVSATLKRVSEEYVDAEEGDAVADLLRRAYAQPGLDGATDDAMLVERLGAEVIVVDGDPRNVKVTTPGDLALVRALLRK